MTHAHLNPVYTQPNHRTGPAANVRRSDGGRSVTMTRNDPKTVRVTCPQCDVRTAFATIPTSCAVVPERRADGKVHSECPECDAEFLVHFAHP